MRAPLINPIGPDTFEIKGLGHQNAILYFMLPLFFFRLPEKTPRPLLFDSEVPPMQLKEQLKNNNTVKLVANFLEAAAKLLESKE